MTFDSYVLGGEMKVLLVDDEPDILEQGKVFLEREDDRLEVETVSSAEGALGLLDEGNYDAVVSDYKMPGMDGLEFLEVVRKKRNSDVSFIIFTGKGREDVAMEALNLGADRYLRKGGSPKSQYGVLSDAIVREVKRYRAERKVEKLYSLNSSVRRMNQLMARKSDLEEILQESCKILRNAADFMDVEIAVLNDQNRIEPVSHCGPHERKGWSVTPGGKGEAPICVREVLESRSAKVIESVHDYCGDCEYCEHGPDHKSVLTPMIGRESLVGILIACIEKGREITDDELGLLRDAADSLAHTIYGGRMKKRLEKSEREKSLILDSMGERIAYHDTDHNLVWANQAYAEARGESLEGLKGRKCYEIWLNREEPCEGCPVDKALRTGEPEKSEMSPPGGEGDCLVSGSPVRDEGKIIGAIETTLDITERKEAEEKLKHYRRGVEASGDSIYMIDGDHRYVFANDEHLSRLAEDGRISRKSRDEVIGKKYWDVHPEKNSKTLENNIEKVKKTGEPHTEEHEFSDVDRYSSRTYSPVKDPETGEVEAVAVVSKDITERKELERELRESEKRFRKFFESLGDAVFVTKVGGDDYGRILEVNPAAEEQTGYSREELIGMNIVRDLSAMPAEERDLSYDEWDERLASGETVTALDKKRRKDGSEYWTEVMTTPIEYEGEKVSLSINRDITERKEAEEREEFLHSLLRHDVRNKAQAVQGYLELLKEADLPDEEGRFVEKALNACEGEADIIEKVRTLRRIERGEGIRRVSIDSVIKDVIDKNEPRASEKGISIEREKSECKVRGGPLLEELFLNLLENSIVHSGCEKIRISSEETEDECIVTVEDDGRGISDEDKDKIFEKGFKKGKTAETGLGTCLVKEIAESYGGSVGVKDSELGGARFDVHLKKPASSDSITAS